MSADWTESAEAKALLCELDAAERSSDCYSGWGWRDVARSFAERCTEIEGELDELRCDAVNALADAAIGRLDDRQSDAWLNAWEEADSEFETVESACQRARRLHLGDGLIERAAAA